MKEYWDGAEYVAILRWLTDQGGREYEILRDNWEIVGSYEFPRRVSD